LDGRGAWRDNVFVERLWRSVKYEEVYLRAYDSVAQARLARPIFRFLQLHAAHSSLNARTPDCAYFDGLAAACGCTNFAAGVRDVVPVGLRPPYATPRHRQAYDFTRQRFHLSAAKKISRTSRPALLPLEQGSQADTK
jgi:hypothetical protein